jgi:pantothenate synthetase
LDQYACVDIHWECNHAVSEATGENVGEWEVAIESGNRRVTAKHREITNALWYALKVAEAQADAAYEARQAARQAALNKLTPAEKQLLGIS